MGNSPRIGSPERLRVTPAITGWVDDEGVIRVNASFTYEPWCCAEAHEVTDAIRAVVDIITDAADTAYEERMQVLRDELAEALSPSVDHARLENSTEVLQCHLPDQCAGERCTIHNRSHHHMRSFQQHWRGDRGIMERICEHGVGHPDPDDYRVYTGADDGVHGCDGCCVAIDFSDSEDIPQYDWITRDRLKGVGNRG